MKLQTTKDRSTVSVRRVECKSVHPAKDLLVLAFEEEYRAYLL
jgi:hypothetical protein